MCGFVTLDGMSVDLHNDYSNIYKKSTDEQLRRPQLRDPDLIPLPLGGEGCPLRLTSSNEGIHSEVIDAGIGTQLLALMAVFLHIFMVLTDTLTLKRLTVEFHEVYADRCIPLISIQRLYTLRIH